MNTKDPKPISDSKQHSKYLTYLAIIIHGDNILKSRNCLNTYLDEFKKSNLRCIRYDAQTTEVKDLQEALYTRSLFGEQTALILEGLHSLPTSAKKKSLIQVILDFMNQESIEIKSNRKQSIHIETTVPETRIVLWEKRSLTKTMLKPFEQVTKNKTTSKNASNLYIQIESFPLSSVLFQWLESFLPSKRSGPHAMNTATQKQLMLFQKVVEQESEFVAFTMLARQIRLLIQIKDGDIPGIAPFLVKKLRSQSQAFELEDLLLIHQKLAAIDLALKTGKANLSLKQELDLLQVSL